MSTKPMQGLAAYLRAEARSCAIGKDNRATLMGWAEEVEAALAAPQPVQEPVADIVALPDNPIGVTIRVAAMGKLVKMHNAALYLAAPVQPAIDYEPLHKFAADNRVSYNELCTVVQAAIKGETK